MSVYSVVSNCVILNSECNEGYQDCPCSLACRSDEVLIPHALAINPILQGKGIGKIVVKNILDIARREQKKLYDWMFSVCAKQQNIFM